MNTHTHTHTSSAINTRGKKKSNINPSTPTWNWKKKKKWVDLPFCYWFHENEFHRLSLRCLHSQKLWNQILCREKQRGGGGEKEGREWELVESLNKTPATHRRKKKKKKKSTKRWNIIRSQIQKLYEDICGDWLWHGKEQVNKTDIVLFKSGIWWNLPHY